MFQTCDHCCTRIEGLGVTLRGRAVLVDVNLHVNCRELIALVGPNGAGKTTLLRSILGEVPYSGAIRFRVRGDVRARPRIGYVPQRLAYDADAPVSVLDLMATTMSCSPLCFGVNRAIRSQAAKALAAVEGEHLIGRRIGELSGGELQRVLLAMALIPEPDILLLDEPMTGVDAGGLILFYRIVESLKRARDVAVLLVTHDIAGIAAHADRMVLLNRTILASGSPAEVMADEKTVRAFEPGLWNISKVP